MSRRSPEVARTFHSFARGFQLYDSMIVASALESGCRVLYSEDLRHGQVIEKRLKVINPFAK